MLFLADTLHRTEETKPNTTKVGTYQLIKTQNKHENNQSQVWLHTSSLEKR